MKKRHTPGQIVLKLRKADTELAARASVPGSRGARRQRGSLHRWHPTSMAAGKVVVNKQCIGCGGAKVPDQAAQEASTGKAPARTGCTGAEPSTKDHV